MPRTRHPAVNEKPGYQLMKVALGEAEADLAIVNGNILNVYTGEVLTADTVLVKGNRIAYVGKNAQQSISTNTEVIDAEGKTLIPGLIDGHTHANFVYSVSEMMKYALKGGTTAVITEAIEHRLRAYISSHLGTNMGEMDMRMTVEGFIFYFKKKGLV